ncbi:hypothetical protein [Porphyromonas sp.]|uniref:hypothetical protein n=1 Tax=Porphyromonas sp. TaxID=1924944 RepID=UPI0026DD7043|nr:hypothetical protein [Porphyromonas sp.]MDO4771575.1 hypothetical protein [Porphyromonas sp.]
MNNMIKIAAFAAFTLSLFTACGGTKKNDNNTQETNALSSFDVEAYTIGAAVASTSQIGQIFVSSENSKPSLMHFALMGQNWLPLFKRYDTDGTQTDDRWPMFEGTVYDLALDEEPEEENFEAGDFEPYFFVTDSAFAAQFTTHPFNRIEINPDEEYSPAFATELDKMTATLREHYGRDVERLDLFAFSDQGEMMGFYGSLVPEGNKALGFTVIRYNDELFIYEVEAEIRPEGTWRIDDDRYPAPRFYGFLTAADGTPLFVLCHFGMESAHFNLYRAADGKLVPLRGESWVAYPQMMG